MASTTEAEEARLSALRENIAKKGTNSYYYGHATQRNGPEWDGKEEPRLLATSSATGEVASSPRLASVFESYSWGDEKTSIKVYIDFEGAADVADDRITLETTNNSLTFKLSDVKGKDWKLLLEPLLHDVAEATYKKKSEMFVLTIKKSEEGTWTSITQKK